MTPSASSDKTQQFLPGNHYFLEPPDHRLQVPAHLGGWMDDHIARS